MDDLLILLIRGIVRLIQGPKPGPGQRKPTSQPPPPLPATALPAPQRGQRRPAATARDQLRQQVNAPTRKQATAKGKPKPATVAPAARAVAAPAAQPAQTITGARAATLRRWMTPQTLQAQFILTEIFQPPVALREDRRSI